MDIVTTFQFGTTCQNLIHQIRRLKPRTTKQLFDIATDHADREETVVV
jgi:hypothetical protein